MFYPCRTKALISFAVTAKLICAFVFALAFIRFFMMRLNCTSVDTNRLKCNVFAFQFIGRNILIWQFSKIDEDMGLIDTYHNKIT